MSFMRVLRVGIVASAQLVVAAAFATVAFAGDPVPFASLNGTCPAGDPSGQTFFGSPVTSAHPQILARYTVASGPAQLDAPTVSAGDIIWAVGGSLNINDFPSVFSDCVSEPTNVPFTATFYDQPTAPTTFSGAGNAFGSSLGFGAPGEGQYVADLTLTGGGVHLSSQGSFDAGRAQDFASSGQFAMGTLTAGPQALRVTALDGPRPTWTVTIRALPVAISGLTFAQPVTRPGAFVNIAYTTEVVP